MRRFRIPSAVFGITYLLLIPGFAGLYMTFPDEFFHATVQHEKQLKREEREILDAIRESMISNFVETYGSRSHPRDAVLRWDDIYLYDLQFSDGYFSFDLLASSRGRVDRLPPGARRMRFALSWPRTRPGDTSAKMYGLSRENPLPGSFMREMFPINRRFSDEHQSDTLGFIVIASSLEQKLLTWTKARSGFPGDSEGHFWRLLYLSAITITTVGYGDILPITTRARLWVAAEAVIGVVMIGLFLNSLAEKARRPAQTAGPFSEV